MITPTELYYSKDPIWAIEDRVRLGITDIMLKQQFDEIVFLDPPRNGIH